MYYIRQKYGKLVDASNQLRQHVEAGEMNMAKSLYVKVTGEQPPVTIDDKVWWRFNAVNHVKTSHGFTVEDYASVSHINGRRKYRRLCAMAEARVGGEWEVVYEY
jgi:hypothetical protein